MILARLFDTPPSLSLWDDRASVRAELFGVERLEEHARSLAAMQAVLPAHSKGHPLLGRLLDNAAFLLAAHRTIAEEAANSRQVTPAAEWLIDNYHLVDMQVREIGIDLPPGYYAQLPKLADGPFAGLPRVFGVAWSLVAHTDSLFEPETLRRYLTAYQEVEPLMIGELWAVPITLRIVLIENLRRLAESIVGNSAARCSADTLADSLLGRDDASAATLADSLAPFGPQTRSDAFSAQLAHRLRGQDPRKDTAQAWLDRHLAARNTTIETVVHEEQQRQGASNATIRNIINSLRSIAGNDWTQAFECVCLVDAVLGESATFRQMDFPTRNLYRAGIETMARSSPRSELQIARSAVDAANQAGEAGSRSDPGYYILGPGRVGFEATVRFRPPLQTRFWRTCRTLGIGGYGSLVVLAAAALLALPLWLLGHAGLGGWWLTVLAVVGFVPASDAAVACVNRAAMWGVGATSLPGLELSDGIPATLRTIVAVPALLMSQKQIEDQVAHLEVSYLASPDGDVQFALLSDWLDAKTEHADGDDALLQAAIEGIAQLNHHYGSAPGGSRFLLLHRHRVWNAGEDRWVGWERKRGKLHELNRLLRGATDTTFIDPPAGQTLPQDVRYVVTLDADTRLPRDAVRRMVGKMAHPLNRPRFDPASGRVTEGYSVLQPRVTPSLPVDGGSSLFQRIFSSMDGIDPYAAAVSDVYQDMFGEGSYAGKGIYDIDAFEAALSGRVPDSTLLSHDLFEGLFARAGLASDVEVVEAFPPSYTVATLRQHRWARGDWQLLPWIVPWMTRPTNKVLAHAAIPAIGRWKMLDNLRRTLSAPSAVLALLAGWCLPPNAAIAWTAFVIGTIALPALLPVLGDILPQRRWVTWRSYVEVLGAGLRHAATLAALIVVFLADQACVMTDAITRTLIRLFITRRHLLQWVTAAQAADSAHLGIPGTYRRMFGAPLIGLAAIATALAAGHHLWLLALPFAVLWIASPCVAVWASRTSPVSRRVKPTPDDVRLLRMAARRTWRFFETFVTPADNMLPPDNFQEDPAPVLAHRTSPTNIGLYLLSTAAAHDFGWTGLVDTVDRLEATMAAMARLERYRGHLYNWYETTDLRPLEPRYVSTVDSGNLAGHLVTLAGACRGWRTRSNTATPPVANDAIDLAQEEFSRLRQAIVIPNPLAHDLAKALAGLHGSDGAPASVQAAIDLARTVPPHPKAGTADDLIFWIEAAGRSAASRRRDASPPPDLSERLATMETAARQMAMDMQFGFLRNHDRKLLSIGYLVLEDMIDGNCYDLLASEARLAVFFAIAKGDVPAREWFRLGRAVVPAANGAALVSWSGSMFEYLMPSLVMRAPGGSLIAQTNRLVVQRQIDFGTAQHIPWGVSESAYNVRDLEFTYQYSNFGIPDLGLKRGLDQDLVVAPYATGLASMVDPRAAAQNLVRLAEAGGEGRYGFYEALDYTPSRIPNGQAVAIVRAYMAHHQGMTVLAIADALLDGVMRTRFHADPLIQASELLLQERAPRTMAIARPLPPDRKRHAEDRAPAPAGGRRFGTAQGEGPATLLLSNGRYAVMLTAAGSGYSRWHAAGQDMAVTRWREDPTLDDWGSYIYLRDVGSGRVWSAGLQPCGVEPDEYDVSFREDRAEFARRDGTLTTTMEVLVSAEADAEVRRISISNAGKQARFVDITSYAELALAPQAADIAHPAFAKLFVQTEYRPEDGVILATRRRRAASEPEIWAAHLAVTDTPVQAETSRARFIGRGHTLRNPAALAGTLPLSGTAGTVLDAAFALRTRVRIAPGAMVRVAFWTMAAATREDLLGAIDKHRDIVAFDRASMLAWTQAQVQLRHLGIRPAEADRFQQLAGTLVFAGAGHRPGSEAILRGSGPQPGLWSQGISGDRPILLLRIDDVADLDAAREMLLAHEYMRLKQLAVDLVILNEHAASYSQDLQVALQALLRAGQRTEGGKPDGRGAVYLLRADMVPAETCALLAATARAVFRANHGGLAEHFARVRHPPAPKLSPPTPGKPGTAAPPLPPLEFANGMGGFTNDGREYVVVLSPGHATPAPWINVVANPGFGFQAAAEGSGYTWAANSRENQLTPWSNDPVADRPGEVFYIGDQATHDLWCPTAAPARDPNSTYVAHHGHGYSRFDRTAFGIASSLVQYVALSDPVKVSRLQLHNLSGRTRSISVTAYVEWVLGSSRTATAAFVSTAMDPATTAMFARNLWSASFGTRVAFVDLSARQTSWTGDRTAFLGRNGDLACPAALTSGQSLPGTVGAGLDPCGALRTTIELPPDGHAEIVCFLGQAETDDKARRLLTEYRHADLDAVLAAVTRHWDGVLGAVVVKTPDRSMDIMLNGWLLYQALACRVWARAGFYQASGAYGFRDQLQDGMALVASSPGIVREHLLRAASRQFIEGDVQHWWLPETGTGVRTRISDDCAWLAYTTAHYVDATGDTAVLDAPVPFLAAPLLAPGENERFFLPATADETASLFEHCARALDHSLAVGAHGLPLMGTGDWNDGMNRIGEAGRGESVWLGWFLHVTLVAFAPLAEARHDLVRAAAWRAHAAALEPALEAAWDGEWYLRAFFDDGTPLGSHVDAECRIDAIAQSWAVLSGVAAPGRAAQAMAASMQNLVHDDLMLVLTPPFDTAQHDPGYIKGYPPGIRENGGQYTHAALWTVMAAAALGDGDKAASLFAMLNPINRTLTQASVDRYKVEPYAVVADVYSTPPNTGRGGWSWYTGSAGWMQRAGIESILGIRIRGTMLHLDPCIPSTWPGYQVTITWRTARYLIEVQNPAQVCTGIAFVTLDGVPTPAPLPLSDDGKTHSVQVTLGP